MSVICEKGVITAPASTGNQTYNLGTAFNGVLPMAIILWATFDTAHGIVNGDGIFSMGAGTYRSSTVQQWYSAYFDDDAAGTTAMVTASNTDAILRGLTGDDTTLDYEADLVSLVSGTPSQFTLNWVAVPASQILVHYFVIGGSDVTDAYAFAWTMATSTPQDVTVVTGFGKPELIMLGGHQKTVAGPTQGDASISMGWAKSSTERSFALLQSRDGTASVTMASWVKDRAVVVLGTGNSANAEGDLSANTADWPTDGFEMTYPDTAASSWLMKGLAFRLDAGAQVVIGRTTIPTTGAPNAQSLSHGGVPKGAMFWGTEIPANAGIDSTHANLGGFVIGGMDGTNEGFAGTNNDDGDTASRASRYSSASKAFARHIDNNAGGAATLDAQADGTISGSNVVLTWDDVASDAAEYSYILFGETAAATPASLSFMRRDIALQGALYQL